MTTLSTGYSLVTFLNTPACPLCSWPDGCDMPRSGRSPYCEAHRAERKRMKAREYDQLTERSKKRREELRQYWLDKKRKAQAAQEAEQASFIEVVAVGSNAECNPKKQCRYGGTYSICKAVVMQGDWIPCEVRK
jgi:hypothetical protein